LTDDSHAGALNNAQLFPPKFYGSLISAAVYTPATATETSGCGQADAFGRLFIANPDLGERIAGGFPSNAYDRSKCYGGGERGYTDSGTYHAYAPSGVHGDA
jgi:N-ethylmaleimide reductase